MINEVSILFVGDVALRELAVTSLSVHSATHCRVDHLEAAMDAIRDQAFDLIVLWVPRRGMYSTKKLLQLQRNAPLSRVVVVAGPWCEGPWRRDVDRLDGMTIVPWHRWSSWLTANLGQWRRGMPATWSLPATASVDEFTEFWSRRQISSAAMGLGSVGPVVVHSTQHDAAETISDMLALGGFTTIWQPAGSESLVRGAGVFLFDAGQWNCDLMADIAEVRRQSPAAVVMVLLPFPLGQDVTDAQAAGVTTVLAKPFTLSEFLGQLEASLPRLPKVSREQAA